MGTWTCTVCQKTVEDKFRWCGWCWKSQRPKKEKSRSKSMDGARSAAQSLAKAEELPEYLRLQAEQLHKTIQDRQRQALPMDQRIAGLQDSLVHMRKEEAETWQSIVTA